MSNIQESTVPRNFIAVLFLALALAACATKTPQTIADLRDLPQDAALYHGQAPDTQLLSPDVQRQSLTRFLQFHFGPWHRQKPADTADDVFWGLTLYPKKELYGENTLKRDPAWIERMRVASRPAEYPSMGRKAIAVTNTSMRVLPTAEPAFYDFSLAGEGFPFDYMQNSLALAGTPLYATHSSADGAWILVESRFAFGWVPLRDIAWVDDAFAAAWQTGQYAAFTRDDVPVADRNGIFRMEAHIGTILPMVTADGMTTLLVPTRSSDGEAVMTYAPMDPATAEAMPLAPTPANFARLINNMLGRPYGWGGLFEDRDCSAATMDLMASFGVFLPRNSSQQVKIGTLAQLKDMDADDKKKILADSGTPFLTMVRKPGHIMLYIGTRDGEPVVFHAIWGLKTKTETGFGRKVIGRAVITSLEPGIELDDLARPDGLLIETVTAITTLP